MSTFKIVCLPTPASGHINPLLPILNELNKSNIEILVYTSIDFKNAIESTGAKFRYLINFDPNKYIDVRPFSKKREFHLMEYTRTNLDLTADNLEYLAKEIDREKPNLILYDILWNTPRWVVRYFEKRFTQTKLPPLIAYQPSFCTKRGIYPNDFEVGLFLNVTLKVLWNMLRLFISFYRISFRFGLKFVNPLSDLENPIENTRFVLTTVFPELQPRAHLFDKKIYKFIGATIDDRQSLKLAEAKKDPIHEILKRFEARNSKLNILADDQEYLIYVSLGTVFNNNLSIYKMILDAVTTFDLELDSGEFEHKVRFKQFKLVVSTGEKVYNQFEKMIRGNEYSLSENILLVKSAPQIEILKRAALFITHCGCNSSSESVHYGGSNKFF